MVNDREIRPKQTARREADTVSTVTTRELFGSHRCLHIIHNNEQYTLRITANDKLILTK